jgi:hypothetical protein
MPLSPDTICQIQMFFRLSLPGIELVQGKVVSYICVRIFCYFNLLNIVSVNIDARMRRCINWCAICFILFYYLVVEKQQTPLCIDCSIACWAVFNTIAKPIHWHPWSSVAAVGFQWKNMFPCQPSSSATNKPPIIDILFNWSFSISF